MARQSRAPTLLLTRPAPQSQRFAQQVAAVLGDVPVVISPLMQTVFHTPPLPARQFQAVIFTSETGVEAATRLGLPLPSLAFCVGPRTAEAASKSGFDAQSANGDAQALVALIRAAGRTGPFLHLRGADSAGDLASRLTNGGLETQSVILYTQEPLALSAEARDLFDGNSAVVLPFFSPRSAQLLVADLPKTRRAPLWVAAISPAAAEIARSLQPLHLLVSDQPNGDNMLHAVAALYRQAAKA